MEVGEVVSGYKPTVGAATHMLLLHLREMDLEKGSIRKPYEALLLGFFVKFGDHEPSGFTGKEITVRIRQRSPNLQKSTMSNFLRTRHQRWSGRSGSEQGSSQMTIFYAGKVLVFDNLPASKAKELMLLVSKGTSQNVLPISLPSNGSTTNSSADGHSATLPQQQNLKAASISGINSHLDNLRQSTPVEGFANSSHKIYMPIARKASLHRFLEKRKDRVNSKAPYQVNQASATQREPEETNS